jgi:hypothetical protein
LGQRSTEKMVPTEMLTSMLDEPSSGSNSRRYSPRGCAWGWDAGRPFLGRERGEVAAPFVRLEQDLVGEDVQLLLDLALDVAVPAMPVPVGQGALVEPGC